jgi:hypothetical protein
MAGQFVSSPKNLVLRRGGSRVSRTGREESGPLSDPRQIAVCAINKAPQRTSNAPSPVRNILASQFIAARHNRRFKQMPANSFRQAKGSDRRGSLRGCGIFREAKMQKRSEYGLAEPEGFEPSIGLYNPITV